MVLDIPGKIFVLGEYAVLAGLPALVAAVPPRFRLTAEKKSGAAFPFASGSPAFKLWELARRKGASGEWNFAWEDPYSGAGGFGASTAQFGLLYHVLASELGWDRGVEAAWRCYRELTRDAKLPPSGADLLAQYQGGLSWVQISGAFSVKLTAEPSWVESYGENFLVFSAAGLPGRKVNTHEHLDKLAKQGFPSHYTELMDSLRPVLENAAHAAREGDLFRLGQSLNNYADVLARNELEVSATWEDRVALSGLPGVLGCKGAGALQSDALLVLVEPGSHHREAVLATARTRGLKLICGGITGQPGIQEA